MTELSRCLQALQQEADPVYRQRILRWFKTAPGQYAAHDRFLGVAMPRLRALERTLPTLDDASLNALLQRPENEARMLAWLHLCRRYRQEPESALQLAWAERRAMNNWNLVDTAAPQLFGRELMRAPAFASELRRLTHSNNLWERRIALVSCLYPVRQGEIRFCLEQAERLLDDRHDLIHKALGWLLREVGKRQRSALETFLQRHRDRLPRTSLRYAIERFSADERRFWLARPDSQQQKPEQ